MSIFISNLQQYQHNCIDLIGYTINNLRYTYLQHCLFSNLNEAYTPLNTTPYNFKASLITVIQAIQTNNIININDIIDELNKEFLFANILFDYKKKSIYNYRPKYKKEGIIDGAGNKDGLNITVNDTFINILTNPTVLTKQTQLDDIAEALFLMYSHETTHEDQTDKEKIPQVGINIHSNMDDEEIKAYYSNIREIASHAREVADQLLLTGKSLKEIEQLLTTWKGTNYLCSHNKVFLQYYMLFGIGLRLQKSEWKDTTEKDLEIFNRFKKYITYFLRLDIQFINKNPILYLLKNKPKNNL